MKQSAGPVHPPGSRPCASTSDFTCRQTRVSLNGLRQRFDLFSAAQKKPCRRNDHISDCNLHQRRLRPNAVDQPRKSAQESGQKAKQRLRTLHTSRHWKAVKQRHTAVKKRVRNGQAGWLHSRRNGRDGAGEWRWPRGMAKRGGTLGYRPCSPAHLVEQGRNGQAGWDVRLQTLLTCSPR